MKVTIVGKRDVSYVKKDTGELTEGIELYFYAPSDDVEGNVCDSIWIPKRSRYTEMLQKLSLAKPVNANIVNEIPPGKKFPQITEFVVLGS
jgi:hypothetical protein